MTLRHIDGSSASLREWNSAQIGLAVDWKLRDCEHLTPNEALTVWMYFFAKVARDVCEACRVDLETFMGHFPAFEDAIVEDIRTMKHLLSEQHGQDVGFQVTASHISFEVRNIYDLGRKQFGTRVQMLLRHVDNEQESTVRSAFFPASPAGVHPEAWESFVSSA